jgi:GntR family transcriptional repressor for pyruvate dehydrogenase complex
VVLDPYRLGGPVQTAPQQIAAALKEAILDGSLKPGEKLPSEIQLTEIFAVSRPTVREALRQLQSLQVLTLTRGRNGGYRVADCSPSSLGTSIGEFISLSLGANTLTSLQLLQVRHALEVLSARVAALERTEEDLVLLAEALPRAENYSEDSVEEAQCDDFAFHRALASATHNPLIIGFTGAATIAFRQVGDDVRLQLTERIVEHLDEVLDAVRRRDPDDAASAMESHLQYSRSSHYAGGLREP